MITTGQETLRDKHGWSMTWAFSQHGPQPSGKLVRLRCAFNTRRADQAAHRSQHVRVRRHVAAVGSASRPRRSREDGRRDQDCASACNSDCCWSGGGKSLYGTATTVKSAISAFQVEASMIATTRARTASVIHPPRFRIITAAPPSTFPVSRMARAGLGGVMARLVVTCPDMHFARRLASIRKKKSARQKLRVLFVL